MDAMLAAPEIIHINHSSKVAASQKTPPPDITICIITMHAPNGFGNLPAAWLRYLGSVRRA
jgi:hypothetical protein